MMMMMMHQNIQLIRIKVCLLKTCEHIGGLSPTFCGLFMWQIVKIFEILDIYSSSKCDFSLVYMPFLSINEAVASRTVFVIVSSSDGWIETLLELPK